MHRGVLVKVDPNMDLYMRWSRHVDGPARVGAKADFAEWSEDLAKADQTGTSDPDGLGGWYCTTGLPYHDGSRLHRVNYKAFALLMLHESEVGQNTTAHQMLFSLLLDRPGFSVLTAV